LSPRAVTRLSLAALVLIVPLALAGCSGLRPVYGTGGVVQDRIALAYDKPSSRLEQIIIQDLALRLGMTEDPDAPTVSITAVAAARTLTRTGTVKAMTQHEVAVSASYSVTSNGEIVAQGTRRATASYGTSGQILADDAAYKDAVERAGHEVAETIRLSILGDLSTQLRDANLQQ
jgi:LPS-assembly lipoprotein